MPAPARPVHQSEGLSHATKARYKTESGVLHALQGTIAGGADGEEL